MWTRRPPCLTSCSTTRACRAPRPRIERCSNCSELDPSGVAPRPRPLLWTAENLASPWTAGPELAEGSRQQRADVDASQAAEALSILTGDSTERNRFDQLVVYPLVGNEHVLLITGALPLNCFTLPIR